MKRLQTFVLVLLLGSFGSISSAADRWETLRAINMVENPTNQTGYGSMGELGPYQFRSSTWRMHSTKPFRMANDRAAADQVAVQHYEWIKERLTSAGIDANSYNIALAWNCGISGVINGRIPMQTYHYAERVNNLADSYCQPAVEVPIQIVLTEKSNAPKSQVEFKVNGQNNTPEFNISTDSLRFRVAGEVPRFVITAVQPSFVLVYN